MVTGELQVVEAKLDLVTDYDGNLLKPMTTPNTQLEKYIYFVILSRKKLFPKKRMETFQCHFGSGFTHAF